MKNIEKTNSKIEAVIEARKRILNRTLCEASIRELRTNTENLAMLTGFSPMEVECIYR